MNAIKLILLNGLLVSMSVLGYKYEYRNIPVGVVAPMDAPFKGEGYTYDFWVYNSETDSQGRQIDHRCFVQLTDKEKQRIKKILSKNKDKVIDHNFIKKHKNSSYYPEIIWVLDDFYLEQQSRDKNKVVAAPTQYENKPLMVKDILVRLGLEKA